MKKVMFIMAAALLMMTQCKKENATPNNPAEGTVKMTVTAGSGRTSIDTENGAITWSAGDKIYVSDGTSWLGSLTLVGEGGIANGTFTGNVIGIGDGTTTCHFFYLGHDNGVTELTGSTAASISFAEQDGTLASAMKYHLGYGNTSVTVTEGEATGSVIMNTKIAIAHLNLTTDGTSAYTGQVTMGGTGISNTMTVSPDGTFSGSGSDGITIGGTTGERYVTLIPTAGTDRVKVAFTGDVTGSMTFLAGISENKFYGMKDALAVTVKLIKFTVDGNGTTVKFAPGNLYYNRMEEKFCFEASQTEFYDEYIPHHVSHFLWSPDKEVAASESTSVSGSASDVFFTNDPSFQVEGYDAGTWRALSSSEWNFLLSNRPDENRFATAKVNDVGGLLIFPDNYSGTTTGDGIARVNYSNQSFPASSIPEETWTEMEGMGVIFLPAAGYRQGMEIKYDDSYYAISNPYSAGMGRFMCITNHVTQGVGSRSDGSSVRLVRNL